MYYWTFGDGGDSDLAQPTHVYPQPGTYIVTINVAAGPNTGSVIESMNVTITAAPTASALSLFAGNMGGIGSIDGTGSAARFYLSQGMTTDGSGNMYVADTGNNTIRKITPSGVVTTIAGSPGVVGSADGVGPAASFNTPTAVAVDNSGNVYVTDFGNNTVRKITSAGVVSTFAGQVGNGVGQSLAQAMFGYCFMTFGCSSPGIATDNAGNVFVSDPGDNIIRKITPSGILSIFAGTPGGQGNADGVGPAAHFQSPAGLAIDSAGNIYVADSGNGRIRKITPSGVVTTIAGINSSVDGTTVGSVFEFPQAVAVDSTGNVYVANTTACGISEISSSGNVTILAGASCSIGLNTDGIGMAARFNYPQGITVDNAGNVFVADTDNNTIRKIDQYGVVTTFVGAPLLVGDTDGTGAFARFNSPTGLENSQAVSGIAADKLGNIYVSDSQNNKVRKITPAGAVSTFATVSYVDGLAADGAGNLYTTEYPIGGPVYKITPTGVTTPLSIESVAPGSTQSNIIGPDGVAVDNAGNVYVSDGGATIDKVTPNGVFSTYFASSVSSLNSLVLYIATDSAGNVYASHIFENTIHKISPQGVDSILAGTPGVRGSADGMGAGATFSQPQGLVVDGAGNVYVSDWGNSTIRKITPAGLVSTVVGVPGEIGFVAGALPGRIPHPYGLALSGGSLYITTQGGVIVVANVP